MEQRFNDEYDSSNNKPLNSNNNKNDNDNGSYLGRTIKEGAKALQFIIGETHGTAITDIAISKAKSIFGHLPQMELILFTLHHKTTTSKKVRKMK